LHSTKWSNGKKKKEWKPISSKKNNSIQDSVEDEENGYPVPDLKKKKMITVTKEPMTPTQKISKKKFWKISQRNSWRRY
jgi:hypothetical protein